MQSGTTLTLTATASDAVGVTRVEFYRGTTLLSTDAAAPYQFPLTVSAADNGIQTFSARAYDAAGNVGTGGVQVNINVTSQTLYQGVWGWGLIDSAGTLIDKGAVVFSEQVIEEGRIVAFGGYINQAQTRQGFSLMGPISAVGVVQVGFTASTDPNSSNIYFLGEDDDNSIGTFEGKAIFEGSGSLFSASNMPTTAVGILLIQTSTAVPTTAAAQAAARAEARTLAARLATQRNTKVAPLKSDLETLRGAAASILSR